MYQEYSTLIFEYLCGLDEEILEEFAKKYNLPEVDVGEIHNTILDCEDLEEFCSDFYLI